jgi:predicted N-acetyltransferase YhbS
MRVRDLTPADAPAVTDLYADCGWWADRTQSTVRSALAETDVAVGVVDGDAPVATARVLTDYTYYANVFDVIVAADRRGEGIGERLLRAVVDHPALRSVDGLSLLCREGLLPYYESVGFERFDPETEVPEGGTERIVRTVHER